MSVRSGLFAPTVNLLELGHKFHGDLGRGALIGARRIGEAVAHHPGAALERGNDRLIEMVDPRGGEEQRFPLGAELGRKAR